MILMMEAKILEFWIEVCFQILRKKRNVLT